MTQLLHPSRHHNKSNTPPDEPVPAPAARGGARLGERAAATLERLRQRRPRVHCLTNTVAEALTANVLLAVGAVPSMTANAEEAPQFVEGAEALLVNLGTLDAARRATVHAVLAVARRRAIPWVLDPVFVDRSASRCRFARDLFAAGVPAAVRANAAEIAALTGNPAAETDAAIAAFASAHPTTLAITGETDTVATGGRRAQIFNGHPLMAKVTATGCAASALVAAFLAVEADPFVAALGAIGAFGVAAEIAAERAAGPGTFPPHFLDALHGLDPDAFAARLRLA